jgi:hypothetical protein
MFKESVLTGEQNCIERSVPRSSIKNQGSEVLTERQILIKDCVICT